MRKKVGHSRFPLKDSEFLISTIPSCHLFQESGNFPGNICSPPSSGATVNSTGPPAGHITTKHRNDSKQQRQQQPEGYQGSTQGTVNPAGIPDRIRHHHRADVLPEVFHGGKRRGRAFPYHELPGARACLSLLNIHRQHLPGRASTFNPSFK